MLLKIYRILLFAAAPFLVALVYVRALRGHEEKPHLKERWGKASLLRPPGRIVWVHAASVGEMQSIQPLINRMLEQNDDLHCLITTVTMTAARLVRRKKNPRILHQYAPLDRQGWITRFLNHWQPGACIWVESEFWPNTLQEIKKRSIPLVLINGRLSERSACRWAKMPQTIAYVLGLFDATLAQSGDDGARLKALGAQNIEIAGNMKYSNHPLAYDEAAYNVLHAQLGGRPLILFSSTHTGEEAMAARVLKTLSEKHPDVLGIVIPRHPSRGAVIADQVEAEGVSFALRSLSQPITAATQIYIADTLGETGLFYRLAPIAYIGNSMFLSPGGGHNPIEPAQLGCAILYGPHMANFAAVDQSLRDAGGALRVRDERALLAALDDLLNNPARAKDLAKAASDFVAVQNSVLDKVASHVRPALASAGVIV